jgi:hypothetical protein
MFDKDVLRLDPPAEVDRITETLREQVLGQLRRRGQMGQLGRVLVWMAISSFALLRRPDAIPVPD